MHNGFLTVDAEKMSKSIGNTVSPQDMLREARPLAVRYYLGQAHYRSVLDYRPTSLREATAAVERARKKLPVLTKLEVECDRLEQVEHLCVVDRVPEQAPTDHLREVIVTDRQRVGVAEGPLRRLGGRPLPHAGQRHQRRMRRFCGAFDQPLQRIRTLGASHHRAGPAGIDVGPVELPRRDPPPGVGGRRDPQMRRPRSGCRRAEPGDQATPATVRIDAVDALLQDCG